LLYRLLQRRSSIIDTMVIPHITDIMFRLDIIDRITTITVIVAGIMMLLQSVSV
jgi:hypothetical protein